MKRRMISVGVAVAVAAAVVAAVLLWPAGSGSNKVYAITDVPQILKAARTLHIKGCVYNFKDTPDGQSQIQRQRFEIWADQEHGFIRRLGKTFASQTDDKPVQMESTVTAGDYEMTEDHLRHTVTFTRRSEFDKQFYAKTTCEQFLTQLLGDPLRVGGFVRDGQETLDGEVFDIWQRQTEVHPGMLALRYRVWVSPATGRIGHVRAWSRILQGDQPWRLSIEIDAVQYDAAPPAGVFDTEPPAGFTLQVPKEAAPTPELDFAAGGRLDDLEIDYRVTFQLPDGTLLACWRSVDHAAEGSQAPFFEDLTPGGPLPKLPIEVYAVVAVGTVNPVTYAGRHLAVTRKDDRFFEWSLFVPESQAREMPAAMLGYRTVCRYNPPDRKVNGHLAGALSGVIAIDTEQDFDNLVRTAMAELSDPGSAAADVTWQSVTQLAAKIRESLAAERAAATEPGEQDLIEYLRKMAEHNGGVFDGTGYNPLKEATGGRTGTWEPSAAEMGAVVNALGMTSRAMEFVNRSEVQVLGSGVKIGDVVAVLAAWRIRGTDTLRVLYGDLHTRDFDPDSPEFKALSEQIVRQQAERAKQKTRKQE